MKTDKAVKREGYKTIPSDPPAVVSPRQTIKRTFAGPGYEKVTIEDPPERPKKSRP